MILLLHLQKQFSSCVLVAIVYAIKRYVENDVIDKQDTNVTSESTCEAYDVTVDADEDFVA